MHCTLSQCQCQCQNSSIVMKTSIFIAALCLAIAEALPSSSNGVTVNGNDKDCVKAVPFMRAYNPVETCHLYTTDATAYGKAISDEGFNPESDAGFVFDSPDAHPDLIPLFALNNPSTNDNLYTVSSAEVKSATAFDGYIYDGVAAYVFNATGNHPCSSVPFYRMYNFPQTDEFYTTNYTEAQTALKSYGFTDLSVECYILSTISS